VFSPEATALPEPLRVGTATLLTPIVPVVTAAMPGMFVREDARLLPKLPLLTAAASVFVIAVASTLAGTTIE
jgi:hypothetical protein